jgi:hemoglobin-like flavoprotein
MDRHRLIVWSLERLAERHGDPAPEIYAKLFTARPDLERLFAMDKTGAVRGNMLAVAFDALTDISGPNSWGLNLILAEQTNHEGLNVPPAEFRLFISVIHDTVRDLLAEEWTEDSAHAWRSVLEEIDSACANA